MLEGSTAAESPQRRTRVLFASAGATMRHPNKHSESISDALSGGLLGQLAHKADAAGILVLEAVANQALFGWILRVRFANDDTTEIRALECCRANGLTCRHAYTCVESVR
jgi:hypothetical protein